jgi:2-aminoadipate transaminase
VPAGERGEILRLAAQSGAVVVENDIYGELRYEGSDIPSLKQLDASGVVVQLRSFSKVAFPGLRVGWVLGPRPLIARLAEAKQWSDLHTDQLSQALLVRFAESGRLEAHRRRVVAAGRQRLAAALAACRKHLPEGARFTRPQGGMNLWVELPGPLDTFELQARARAAGVSYLPGKYFAVALPHAAALRLSFAGLPPDRIGRGVALLGRVFGEELERVRQATRFDAAPALV